LKFSGKNRHGKEFLMPREKKTEGWKQFQKKKNYFVVWTVRGLTAWRQPSSNKSPEPMMNTKLQASQPKEGVPEASNHKSRAKKNPPVMMKKRNASSANWRWEEEREALSCPEGGLGQDFATRGKAPAARENIHLEGEMGKPGENPKEGSRGKAF